MLDKCKCGRIFGASDKRSRQIESLYGSRVAKIFVLPGVCDICAINDWKNKTLDLDLQSNNEMGKRLFDSSQGNGLRVNWEAYFYLISLKKDQIEREVNMVLYELNFLSPLKAGVYMIMNDRLIINPSVSGAMLFFTNKDDAIQYAKLKFGNVLYSWNIISIGEVIQRHEI